MSSFWTPSGEHRVAPGDHDVDEPAADLPPDFGAEGDIDPATAAAMEERLRQAQEELLSVPAAQIVANHIIGLFELAALHLRVDPPDLDEARLPIDAMGLLVDNLGPLLPDHATLTAALQQLRMAYVELHDDLQGEVEDDEDALDEAD